ncbi:hypothetical protein HPB49_004145 [Dermacentor silvarum]|uniref:Uncharacterized protein n=1 Tax=Dermacentor silvarum TaxID=543639 RepID=A0ACB8C226_DERSI|nr:hypothetical protein HPB49_004145 [Dermacentor silvarum]
MFRTSVIGRDTIVFIDRLKWAFVESPHAALYFTTSSFASDETSDSRRRKKTTNSNFFSLPKIVENQRERTKALSTKRRSLWLARIKRANLDIENSNLRVCGAHFIAGKPPKLFDETDPDWAPSLLLGYSAMNTDPSRHLEK